MTDFWRNRKVAVTGGTGFLGYHIVKQLLEAGAQVRSFALSGKPNHSLMGLPIDMQWGDIRDMYAVRRAVAGCDVVFHTAGPVAVWGASLDVMEAAHRHGTGNVIDAVACGTRIVHTSSIVTVGASRSQKALDEDNTFDLDNLKVKYVQAKRAAEEVALTAAAAGRNVVVVNPGYLIGPEDFEPSVMGKICDRVWKGKMAVAAPGGYNLADVRDVAAGHLLAAEHGTTGRRYILGGENRSLVQFIRLLTNTAGLQPRATLRLPMVAMWLVGMIAELRSLKTKKEPYPSFQHVRMNRYSWFVRSDRAERELGYKIRPLTETTRDMYVWYSSRGTQSMRGFTRWWMRPAA